MILIIYEPCDDFACQKFFLRYVSSNKLGERIFHSEIFILQSCDVATMRSFKLENLKKFSNWASATYSILRSGPFFRCLTWKIFFPGFLKFWDSIGSNYIKSTFDHVSLVHLRL